MGGYSLFTYQLRDTADLLTPSLIYYEPLIRQNIERILQIAGGEGIGQQRLWPHIKTHKSLDVTRLLMSYGIVKFKAATIAEAEMCCMTGAEKVVLAYPLIGPNQRRYLQLQAAYPLVRLYAIQDDFEQIKRLDAAVHEAREQGLLPADYVLPVLIDVDMGLKRTGADMDSLKEMARGIQGLEGLLLEGFHCYDGHRHEKDFAERDEKTVQTDERMQRILDELRSEGMDLPVVIAGGTPSFPCHAAHTDWYLSPGTSFIHDYGYDRDFPDLGCIPAAAVASRVVSHPGPGLFTCDCGCKAIATDPAPERGKIAGLEQAVTVMQNEEHWVFRLPEGVPVPSIGEVLYILPAHICPTTALYPEVLVAAEGSITEIWPVTARNRKLCY